MTNHEVQVRDFLSKQRCDLIGDLLEGELSKVIEVSDLQHAGYRRLGHDLANVFHCVAKVINDNGETVSIFFEFCSTMMPTVDDEWLRKSYGFEAMAIG